MKKFGTMIIKPDAINAKDLKIIRDILIKYGLYENNLCFIFNNYPEIILKYRKKDILFKNITNLSSDLPDGMIKQAPEEELKYCKIALNAYEKFFCGQHAMALLIPTHDRDYDEFFNSMYNAKKEIRNELKKHRDYCYAYVNYGASNQEMRELTNMQYNELINKNPENVVIAHVDGVHVEDKDCFLNNFCLSFMVSVGIINKSNQTSLQKYIDYLSGKENLL